MNPPTILTRTLPKKKAKEREDLVKDIIRRGNVAKFTCSLNPGSTKYVDAWNPDEDGDLRAFSIKGATTSWVCWDSPIYEVSEVTREEAEK